MYCPVCGLEIEDNSKVCDFCGESIDALDVLGISFKHGDQNAFQEIYEDTTPWVRNHVYNRVSQSNVDDCMQEIYMELFQKIDKFDETKASFRTWFNTLVRNKTTDYLRVNEKPKSKEVEALYDDDDKAIDLVDPGMSPEDVMEKKEIAYILSQVLDEISEEQRKCIMLHYVEGLKYKEIAEILGISEGTVKSRTNYGLKSAEVKVKELEKKGIKLYSMAPLPFFLWLICHGNVAELSTSGNLWGNIVTSTVGTGALIGTGTVATGSATVGAVVTGVAGATIANTAMECGEMIQTAITQAGTLATNVATSAGTAMHTAIENAVVPGIPATSEGINVGIEVNGYMPNVGTSIQGVPVNGGITTSGIGGVSPIHGGLVNGSITTPGVSVISGIPVIAGGVISPEISYNPNSYNQVNYYNPNRNDGEFYHNQVNGYNNQGNGYFVGNDVQREDGDVNSSQRQNNRTERHNRRSRGSTRISATNNALATEYVVTKNKLLSKIFSLIIAFLVGFVIGKIEHMDFETTMELGITFAAILYIPTRISHIMRSSVLGFIVNYIVFCFAYMFIDPPRFIALLVCFAGIIDIAISVVNLIKCAILMR